MNLETVNHTILLIVVVIATVFDWRTTKIPNLLTFPAALCGVFLNFLSGGWHGVLMSVAGWLLGALITAILGNLPIGTAGKGSGIGMGDAKLIAAVGAFLGPKSTLITIFYFVLSFGLISAVLLARTVPWRQVGTLVSTAIFDGDISTVKVDTTKLDAQRKSPIPISTAILIATLLAMFCRTQTLQFFGLT